MEFDKNVRVEVMTRKLPLMAIRGRLCGDEEHKQVDLT